MLSCIRASLFVNFTNCFNAFYVFELPNFAGYNQRYFITFVVCKPEIRMENDGY